MSLRLSLGYVDVPYAEPTESPRAQAARVRKNRRAKPKREAGQVTTGDVGEMLEAKYGLVQAFWDHHGKRCVEELTRAVVGQTENLLMGAPVSNDPFGEATSFIEDEFKQFLSSAEIERYGIEGVPTQAALEGYNPRLKKKRGKRRPSFVATGLLRGAFAAEVER